MSTQTNPTASNQYQFLPVTRTFSEDPEQFLIQITSTYSDISRRLNNREIALYDLLETATGQQWFPTTGTNPNRFGVRKVFSFTGAGLTFNHGISNLVAMTHIYGAFTNGTNFYPLPYVDATAATNQVQVVVTPTQIVITRGAGAPSITSGIIVLEYLKN